MRFLHFREILRFLVAGLTSTVLTMGLFQLLVTFIHPTIAYSLCWITGLLFAAAVYPTFVFDAKRNWTNGLALILVYACVFVFGLFLLIILEQFLVNLRWGILIVVGATTTLNYFASRLVLSWLRNSKACSPS
jgi:putative flippase GtrA